MKKSKFTDPQIAFVLGQAEEGTSVSEVCRKAGIAEATFYNWSKKYGGLMPSEIDLPSVNWSILNVIFLLKMEATHGQEKL